MSAIPEDIIGSSWTEKLPKDRIMKKLLRELDARGENVLVVGDGRAEVAAGVRMGAVVISRLPKSAAHQRKLHKALGTNLIVEDYLGRELSECFQEGE